MDLALFDFDGTITVTDTFSSFLPHAVSPRRLLLGRVVLAPVVVGYKLGLVSAPMIRTLVSAFAFHGKDEATLRAAGERYASVETARLRKATRIGTHPLAQGPG